MYYTNNLNSLWYWFFGNIIILKDTLSKAFCSSFCSCTVLSTRNRHYLLLLNTLSPLSNSWCGHTERPNLSLQGHYSPNTLVQYWTLNSLDSSINTWTESSICTSHACLHMPKGLNCWDRWYMWWNSQLLLWLFWGTDHLSLGSWRRG